MLITIIGYFTGRTNRYVMKYTFSASKYTYNKVELFKEL